MFATSPAEDLVDEETRAADDDKEPDGHGKELNRGAHARLGNWLRDIIRE